MGNFEKQSQFVAFTMWIMQGKERLWFFVKLVNQSMGNGNGFFLVFMCCQFEGWCHEYGS
jgi:hypothetical protein